MNETGTNRNNALATWAGQFIEAVEALERPAPLPATPALTGDPAGDAAALLVLLPRLGCDLLAPWPIHNRNAVAQQQAGLAARTSRNALEQALLAVDRHLTVLAAIGAPGLLAPTHPTVTMVLPGWRVPLIALDVMAADMPADRAETLLTLLPRGELYSERLLFLGCPGRGWYSTAVSVELTRTARRQELETIAHARRQQEEASRRGAEFYRHTPAGKAAAAAQRQADFERRLRELETKVEPQPVAAGDAAR
ncbi:MAG TPA: hypothetical protein VKA46_29640 [Gemmataceae bacterium]|nr:hypothetical protein [Gemmataceae bacterium]